jgi:hypothetical protein
MINKASVIFLVLTAVALNCAVGQVITPVAERNELVDNMKRVVGNMEQPAAEFTGLESPFLEKTVQKKRAEIGKDSMELDEEELPEIISDATAVEVISRRFKPLGSLIFGNRGILQFGNGETIEEGESFPAKIRGTTYTVIIEKVTAQGYTLRVGSATADKTFFKNMTPTGK